MRLGDGTDESRARMIAGLDWCWRFVDELFESDEVTCALSGAGPGSGFAAGGRSTPRSTARWPKPASSSRRRAARSWAAGPDAIREHLGHLLAEMQFLPRAYPDARW